MKTMSEEMQEVKADGVIFHDIFITIDDILNNKAKIICDVSISDIKNTPLPKTNRTYYRIVNGKKEYIK